MALFSTSLLFSDDAYDNYLKGHEYRKKKDYRKALYYCEKALKLQPENGKFNLFAGRLLLDDLKEPEKALPYLKKAVKIMPENPESYYYLASAYRILKENDQSYETYKKALLAVMNLEEKPQGWLFNVLAYQALWEQNPARLDEAEQFFSLAKEYEVEEPVIAKIAVWLAYHYNKAKLYDKTISVLDDFTLIKYRPAYSGYLAAYALGEQKKYTRALDILKKAIPLESERENPEQAWIRSAIHLVISYSIINGDQAYFNKEYKTAHAYYKDAYTMYLNLSPDLKAQKEWEKKHDNKINREYTTNLLYFDDKGHDRKRYVANTFLEQKMLLTENRLPDDPGAVVFKVAVVIVRNTDLEYKEKGHKYREKNYLDEKELDDYKKAWLFASEAVRRHSRGAFTIETDWFDLKDAVLTGLNVLHWKNLVHVRHLDPYQIKPFPGDLFKTISEKYDGVIFCWDRGKAAAGYGGGPISFQVNGQALTPIACVRSMSIVPSVNLHEFLHNIKGEDGFLPVHGPKYPVIWPKDFSGDDDSDWYGYLISNLVDFGKVKYQKQSD